MSADDRIEAGGLEIAGCLHVFVRDELAPGTGVEPGRVWEALGDIVRELGPTNRALLEERDQMQRRLDAWHLERRGQPIDLPAYRAFLEEIGYLLAEQADFSVRTRNVDPEIAAIAGPQLVVPVGNARFAVNAVNARWGSLYDALYVTDVIPEDGGATRGERYNPARGARVIAYVSKFLDRTVPLAEGSHADVSAYRLEASGGSHTLVAALASGSETGLAEPVKLAGFRGEDARPSAILFRNHGLHIELLVDRDHEVGRSHPAGVCDVLLEAAVTTIQDFEDAECAVDAQDKTRLYRSWLGLMRGTLEATVERGARRERRTINPDKTFTNAAGGAITLRGNSLLLVRNVGLHMYTDAVTSGGEEIPEGFLDAMLTTLAAMHDLRGGGLGNSPRGSVYIVKPKLHSPKEVAATIELFVRVENALGLERNTVKIGIMDEERRMTVNLKEAIRAAAERVIFINTGFLDRTGDEIHTNMEAGAVVPKIEMKGLPWIAAYEDWNVDIGLEAGLPGVAQIGKGMWAAPDEMRAMVETKHAHPRAGANTAWVPSPRAAVLHAMHYHEVDVAKRQKELASRPRASLDDILTPPLLGGRNLSGAEIQNELDNNAQGILGYVARWIQQGVGCSKVLDIDDVALMEDRATLRISSQHIANWLYYGLVSEAQVRSTFARMASLVDRQNAGDPHYREMAPELDASIAFRAALDLVFGGRSRTSGYTESVLHERRREYKARHGS